MRRHKGYTMIELIVVLALFSLLFSIAIPNSYFVSRVKEIQELKEFKGDVLLARNQAIVKGKTHYFKLDYPNNCYFIISEGNEVKRCYFESGVTLIHNPAVTEIVFTRSGVPSLGNTIKLKTRDNQRYKLVVNPVSGKITLSEE